MMDIAALTTGTKSGGGDPNQALSSLGKDFDQFLTLLTHQLQNQDPLNPLDSKEFTNQLTQFAQVEQQITQNKTLDSLLGLTQSRFSADAVSYIGKRIDAQGRDAILDGNGADWSYSIPRTADRASLVVTNESGRVVFSSQAKTEAGTHTFQWDGRDNSGLRLPQGIYSMEVTAFDNAEKKLDVSTTVRGTVRAVELDGSEPHLIVGSARIPISQIDKIYEATETVQTN